MTDEAAGAAKERMEEPWRGGEFGISPSGYRLPASVRLGPVRLQVADLGRSEEFYRRVVGLERLDGGGEVEGRARLGVGEDEEPPGEGGEFSGGRREPLVELVEKPGVAPARPRGNLGLYHFALRVPSRRALGRIARHLLDIDVRMSGADHRVSEALYLTDPDGLGIEIYRDRPRPEWRTRGRELVMATEPLDLEDLMAGAAGTGFQRAGREDAEVDGADHLLPGGTRVGHVHFHVGELEEAARFYHESLGFDKVVWSYPGALFLSAGGYHHHVGTNTWARGAGPPGPDSARLLSWTLVVPDPAEVERVERSLEVAGYGGSGEVESGGGGSFLAEDPWGIRVEVVSSRR